MKLTAKLMLALLASVAAVTVAASYISVRAIYADFERQQQVLARQLANDLQGQLQEAYRQQELAGVVRLLASMTPRRGSSLEARWVLFEPLAPVEYQPRADLRYWEGLSVGEMISVMSSPHDHASRLHTYLALPLRNAPWRGGLEITESLEIVENHLRRTIWLALTTIVSVAAMSFMTAYWAGVHWVARPLERLIAKTEQIGRADFCTPLVLSGNDELSQLAAALNRMGHHLANQQESLDEEIARRMSAQDQLRHADRLKTVGRLAAGLAHELGTPLQVISGRAALINSGKLGETEVQSSAKAIKSEADRITNIVRQLLDFARPRTPQRKPSDLTSLVTRTLTLLEPLAEKQGVQLRSHAMLTSNGLSIDESQMQQVITNIVINSIQAMPDGGNVTVSLDVVHSSPSNDSTGGASSPGLISLAGEHSSTRTTHWMRLRIQDNGPGIPQEIQPHLFEPFFTTKEVGEGTGLGLSIAYGIVQDHGGAITVTSTPGDGARFDIYLPLESQP